MLSNKAQFSFKNWFLYTNGIVVRGVNTGQHQLLPEFPYFMRLKENLKFQVDGINLFHLAPEKYIRFFTIQTTIENITSRLSNCCKVQIGLN